MAQPINISKNCQEGGRETIGTVSLLKAISDDKSLTLFNSIALSNGDSYIPLKEIGLTTKQYYSRISHLMKADLIKRHKGRYSVTLLGKIVYEAQMTIGKALSYYWKMRVLESFQESSELPQEELTKIMDVLIEDHGIKEIIIQTITKNSQYKYLLSKKLESRIR